MRAREGHEAGLVPGHQQHRRDGQGSDAVLRCPLGYRRQAALGSLWLRVIYDPLARRRGVELVDVALHAIARTVAPHRSHLVVISRLRLQAAYADTEYRVRMAQVDPDVRFRGLGQRIRIRAILY